MPDETARARGGRQGSRATAQALYVTDLETAGAARSDALREADAHLDRIARLLPDALSAGLTLAEIARIAGVSRPTLYQLRARYGSEAELRLALLETVANGFAPLDSLVTSIGRPEADLWPHLKHFVDTDAMEVEPTEEEEPQPAFMLTDKGRFLLRIPPGAGARRRIEVRDRHRSVLRGYEVAGAHELAGHRARLPLLPRPPRRGRGQPRPSLHKPRGREAHASALVASQHAVEVPLGAGVFLRLGDGGGPSGPTIRLGRRAGRSGGSPKSTG